MKSKCEITYWVAEESDDKFLGTEGDDDTTNELLVRLLCNVRLEGHVREVRLGCNVDRHVAALCHTHKQLGSKITNNMCRYLSVDTLKGTFGPST